MSSVQEAKKRAEEMIAKGGLTDHDYKIAEAKLQRALVRLSVKSWEKIRVIKRLTGNPGGETVGLFCL